MTWFRCVGGVILGLLVPVGCGPAVENDDDGNTGGGSGSDSAASSSTTSVSTSGAATSAASDSASGTSGPVSCPPNSVYAEPGCSRGDPTIVELPEPGCYEVCDPSTGDDSCSVGSCVRTVINPCVCDEGEACCDACGAEQWLCISGEPLESGFEVGLTGQDGCGFGNPSLFAFTSDSGIGMGLYVEGDLMTMAQDSGQPASAMFVLPDEAVRLGVVMGPEAATNFCNDAPFGTILRSYGAISGTVDVTAAPPPPDSSIEAVVTATLTNVVFAADDGGPGEPITVASYTFDAVEVWCCPG